MIALKNIGFGYSRKQRLFSELDLDLEPGRIYGLLGRNGAGKTTLLKIMAGLVFVRTGELSVFGYDPKERIPACLEAICLIPEEYQVPAISIDRYIKLNSPFYSRFDHEKMAWLLGEFDLERSHKLNELSYGQKKKFLIAFGLSTCARLLLMDEPTNGLDIPSKSQFRRVIAASLSDEQTVLISTHQVRDLEALIDPIMIIDKGNIIFNKSLQAISEALRFETLPEIKENMQPLYHEEGLGGYSAIVSNPEGKQTRLDMELLFNGVIANAKRINESFKS